MFLSRLLGCVKLVVPSVFFAALKFSNLVFASVNN
jgi:hypothetical protein